MMRSASLFKSCRQSSRFHGRNASLTSAWTKINASIFQISNILFYLGSEKKQC